MLHFAPKVKWDPKVQEYFEHAFGPSRLQQMSSALCRPSLHTCLRVNTTRTRPQEVVQQLQQLFPGSAPRLHPHVPSAIILTGKGPLTLDLQAAGQREVVINRHAGEAVLQGAHVYAPGLLAATPGLAAGDMVALTVAVEERAGAWCGINRGATLTPQLSARLPGRLPLCVGVGRVTCGRRELFRAQQGLAVEVVQRLFDVVPCNGLLPGKVLLQSLPCVVAAQVLDPQPGSRVLDMCAAPGGKTSMLAQLLAGNSASQLVALDRTAAKAARVRQLVDSWGVGDFVQVMAADATLIYQQQQQQQALVQQQQQPHQEVPAVSAAHRREQPVQSAYHSIPDSSSSSSSSSSVQPATVSNPTREQQGRDHARPDPPPGLPPAVARALQAESFDAVLCDAPCSALGLRPRLLCDARLPQLMALAGYQRALLTSAVHVLRPGGHLVYCTCTINPGENEGNVRYVLDKWPEMQLVQQPLVLGGPGLIGPSWLTPHEAQLVQRFDPGGSGPDDTIGFFIAKFVKTRMTCSSSSSSSSSV